MGLGEVDGCASPVCVDVVAQGALKRDVECQVSVRCLPTWRTSEWCVVYINLQTGHWKRVWEGWIATKSNVRERGLLVRVAVSSAGSDRPLSGSSGCGGVAASSARASPFLAGAFSSAGAPSDSLSSVPLLSS